MRLSPVDPNRFFRSLRSFETSPNGARSCSHRVTRLPMISSMDAQRLVVSALLSFMACASAVAIDWPKTYVVAEDTMSPDGKYALIVQSTDARLADEGRAVF